MSRRPLAIPAPASIVSVVGGQLLCKPLTECHLSGPTLLPTDSAPAPAHALSPPQLGNQAGASAAMGYSHVRPAANVLARGCP